MTRRWRVPLAVAAGLALTACARPRPPVITGPPAPLAATPAPAWLPAGWVEDGAGVALKVLHADHVWVQSGASVPLLEVAWYTPAEARAWPGAPLDYLLKEVTRSLQEPGMKTPAPEPWARAGLAAGWRFRLTQPWREGDRGRVEGQVGLARTRSGGLLQAVALIPAGGDRSLLDDLLRRVPAEP